MGGEVAGRRVEHLRLDRQHEHVGRAVGRRRIERHALLRAKRLQVGAGLRIEHEHMGGRDAQIEPAAQQRSAHAACAHERERPRQSRRNHASPAVSNRAVVRASFADFPAHNTKLKAWK